MSERKLRVRGVGQISIPVANFTINTNFTSLAIQDEDGNDLNWSVEIKPITNFTESTNLFLFDNPIVDFTQPTSNDSYNVDTTLFNVDEYYQFITILEQPGKGKNAIFQNRDLNSYVFKYNGTIENGGSHFLEFTYYIWKGDFSQWMSNDENIITTEDTIAFATFVDGGLIQGGGGGRGGL
jgi:hypothetical protein